MLKYKKISDKDGIKQYEYYPNGDMSAPGIVRFDKAGKAELVKESDEDVKMYFALHALNGIDTTKESGTIAWH